MKDGGFKRQLAAARLLTLAVLPLTVPALLQGRLGPCFSPGSTAVPCQPSSPPPLHSLFLLTSVFPSAVFNKPDTKTVIGSHVLLFMLSPSNLHGAVELCAHN